jgi:hypothetical protein
MTTAGLAASVTQSASQGVDWRSILTAGPVGVILGFLLKAAADWWTGRRKETEQFHIAALLVRDELRANVVKLQIAVETEEDPEPLESGTYSRHEQILAKRLPADSRDAVRGAYVHAKVFRPFQLRTTQGARAGQTGVVEEALGKANRALELLHPHIPKGASEI